MAELHVAHTADLTRSDLRAVRDLLDGAFDDEVTDEDHEHVLGGVHALVRDGPDLLAHGSVVMRRLHHRGRALRTGYLEGVAVRADRRGRGHGAAVMGALERVVDAAYELGALSSSDEALGFYAARGWRVWTGTASVLTRDGLRRTPDDEGALHVRPVSAVLVPDEDLACAWRDGDVW